MSECGLQVVADIHEAFGRIAEVAAAWPAAWRRAPGIGSMRSMRLEHGSSSQFDHRSS